MSVRKAEAVKLSGVRSVRLDEAKLRELLDHLDEEDLAMPGRGRRRSERYAYRLKELVVTLLHPGGTTQSVLVPTRNISATGFAFLHGGFVHTGAACLVQLITTRNTRQAVKGRVVRCKYVEGRVHEVGIRFDEQVEIGAFAEGVVKQRVLVVEEDASLRRQLSYDLEALGAEVRAVASVERALEEAAREQWEVMLLDPGAAGLEGAEVKQVFGSQGCRGRMVALTSQMSAGERERCLSAGFDDYREKPISKEALEELLAEAGTAALFSNSAEGPEIED